MANETSVNTDQKNGNFICGVVEGFYGRPWTTEQRKDLFRKLKKWGMNFYCYAPKDDYKHRAYWRELYTVEEADHLTSLITAAKDQGINFYYALSPGLDMTYSSQKEVQVLKRKLEQVSQFGCEAFALLFDDIESELSKVDKEVFQTFANAQVSVTNEIFTHLNNPRFLFCPTQYCSTRAVPSVTDSEYLNTLGSKLHLEIDIMWTGSKVITKSISIEAMQEISEVLRRPPVIWDNLHANDYDQKRVFLGPYSGRSPELIPLLRGVVTNPNCEFHANTIAIHTLASWSKCSSDTKINHSISADVKLETENDDGIINDGIPSCLSENIYHPRVALKNAIAEWLPEFSIEKDAWGPLTKPQPPLTMVMPIVPIIPSVNTCMSLTTSTTTTSTNSIASTVPEVNTTQLQALAEVCSTVNSSNMAPISNAVMNSLVSATKVVTNDDILNTIASNAATNMEIPKKIPISSIPIPIMAMKTNVHNCTDNDKLDVEIDEINVDPIQQKTPETIEEDISIVDVNCTEVDPSGTVEPLNDITEKSNDATETVQMDENNISPISAAEPMECGNNSVASHSSSTNIAKNVSEDVVMSETVSTCSTTSMQVESSESSLLSNAEMGCDEKSRDKLITAEDLYLLCDLFYLPFEHGNRAIQLLNEFNWLKSNAHVLLSCGKKKESIKPEVQEWHQRSERFSGLCKSVQQLTRKISNCANKELCYDLFSYIWDIAGALELLNAFVKWLSLGHFPANIHSYTQGSYTWFTKGWRETFTSGDQEPWVFRGGLTADLQRLMPVDSGNDLFIYKLPDSPTTDYYIIRPYRPMDETEIYKIYQKATLKDKLDLLPDCIRELRADIDIGAFVTLNPEFCMILENSFNSMVGYACAALDVKDFNRKKEMCWTPAMCEKYPQSLFSENSLDRITQSLINEFHNCIFDCPTEVFNSHPSIMIVNILKEYLILDNSIGKRLVTVLLAALRSNGSFGVHIRISEHACEQIEFYTKLGFTEIYRNNVNATLYYGRSF